MSTRENGHLSAQVLQDFLEDALPQGEARWVEEHVGSCHRCSAELEGWRAFMTQLDAMEADVAPSAGFAEGVMARVPVQRSRWHRLRAWMHGGIPALRPGRERSAAATDGHPTSDLLQDFAEGLVPSRTRPRVEAHVARCALCTREIGQWQALMGSIGSLPYAEPSPGFRERVMAGVRVEADGADARADASGWWSALGRWIDEALDRVGGVVPETPRGRAVAGACLLAPVAALAVVAYYILRQPQVDLQSLGAYAWWQLSEGASALAALAVARLLESPAVLRVLDWAATVLSAPGPFLAALLGAWILCLGAAWVLYRNLITPRTTTTGSHVRA